jgi:hypothetical protein
VQEKTKTQVSGGFRNPVVEGKRDSVLKSTTVRGASEQHSGLKVNAAMRGRIFPNTKH